MRSKKISQQVLVLFAIVATVFILAGCQYLQGPDEVESISETQVRETQQSASSPIEPEAQTKKQTDEPTKVTDSDTESIPPELPAVAVTDMQEYNSVTEFFSVKVPSGWSSEEAVPGADFVMANSEAALERYRHDNAVESGDLVINVGFIPFAFLQEKELNALNIQFEATPDLFLGSLLPMFRVPEDAVLSDVELVSISDERDAGMVTVAADGQEGMILMFTAGDGVIAFVSTIGVSGDMNEIKDIAYAVVAEVAFSGAQDALYGALLRGGG